MAIVATLDIVMGANTSKAEAGVKRVNFSVKQLTRNVNRLGPAIAGAFAGIGATKLIRAIGGFARDGIRAAAGAETAATGFEVLTGSAEKAAATIEQLRRFSSTTPFQSAEVRSAARRLLSANVAVEELTDTLRFLGDASAATQNNLGEVVNIFAKVRSAGRLAGQEFLQFAERGINLQPAIQKNLGITADEFLKLRAAGRITANDVIAAFRLMNAEGGIFFGAIDKLGKTLEGRLSTLRDETGKLSKAFGQEALPGVKSLTESLIVLLQTTPELRRELETLGKFTGAAADAFSLAAFAVKEFVAALDSIPLLPVPSKGGILDTLFPAGQKFSIGAIFRDASRAVDVLRGRAERAGKAIGDQFGAARQEAASLKRINAAPAARRTQADFAIRFGQVENKQLEVQKDQLAAQKQGNQVLNQINNKLEAGPVIRVEDMSFD